MKITFTGTEKEKEIFMDDLTDSDFCPFHSMLCANHDVCIECLRKNIEWDTPEERERKKKERNRRYRETHKEHNRKYLNEWRKNNPEKYKAQKARERQRAKERRSG